jgi:hypothetical protein
MSYFIVYLTPDEDVDGDDVASVAGWAAFTEWASGLPDGYPELAYLGEHGHCVTEDGAKGDALADLEGELRRALAERPNNAPAPVLTVVARLFTLLEDRPEGTVAISVTDGEEDEEEDGADSQDEAAPLSATEGEDS